MSAIIDSLSTPIPADCVDRRSRNELAQVPETPDLEGQSMRSGSVKLARLHYLMTLGERVGIVDTNHNGVKSLVIDTQRYGKVRILDFSGTEQGSAHPYRVQRLWHNPEDYYVNTKVTGETGIPIQKKASFLQGGLNEPEISLGDLLDAADQLLCKLRRSGMSKQMIRFVAANGDH